MLVPIQALPTDEGNRVVQASMDPCKVTVILAALELYNDISTLRTPIIIYKPTRVSYYRLP